MSALASIVPCGGKRCRGRPGRPVNDHHAGRHPWIVEVEEDQGREGSGRTLRYDAVMTRRRCRTCGGT